MTSTATALKCPHCGGPAIEVKLAGRGVRKRVCAVDGCGNESLPYTLAGERALRKRRERMARDNERLNQRRMHVEERDRWWVW